MHREFARTLVAVVLAVGAVAGMAWRPPAASGAQEPSAAPPAACTAPATALGAATPAPDPQLVAGVPDGVTLSLLGSGLAEQLPATPAVMQLSRLSVPPGAGSDTRQAYGPILFYVEAGTVAAYVGGIPTTLPTGGALLVPTDELYAFINEGAAPASLLRLGLTGTGDALIADVVPPSSDLPDAPPPPPPVQLVRGEVAPLPAAGARLFLACLTGQGPEAGAADHSHPGPVGLLVERGRLTVRDGIELPEGGCTLFQAGEAHRELPSDPAAAVLLFGVVPDGLPLWTAATALAAPPVTTALTCGEG